MARSFIYSFWIFLGFILSPHSAPAVLFLAPTADVEDFLKLAIQRNQQTYTQWVQENAKQRGLEAHTQVIEFSQKALNSGSNELIQSDWLLLRQSIELNRADREVLVLLAEKLKLINEVCRYVLLEPDLSQLLEQTESLKSCKIKASGLPASFQAALHEGDILAIDGVFFSKSQLPTKLIEGTYQWRIISNRFQDRLFTGQAENFNTQQMPQRPWVRGNCEKYGFEHPDFSILTQAQVFFRSDCIQPGIPQKYSFNQWAEKNRSLLWGIGIIAAGIAASQLRDKTLVITKP